MSGGGLSAEERAGLLGTLDHAVENRVLPYESALKVLDLVDKGAERFIRALLAARVECPVHGIPDCSPLLNGCSIPRYIAEWRGEFIGDLTVALDESTPTEEPPC